MNTDDLVVCVNLWDQPSWVMSYGKSNGGELIIASRPEGRQAVVENVVKGRLMGYYVVNEQKEAIYEIKGFPSSYVINKEGQVVAAHMGLAPWNTPSVRKWLSGLVQWQVRASFRFGIRTAALARPSLTNPWPKPGVDRSPAGRQPRPIGAVQNPRSFWERESRKSLLTTAKVP
jgi:hypothetical protein